MREIRNGGHLSRFFSTVLFLLLAGSATAQEPELAALDPAGGQRGTTVVVRAEGKNLQGAKALVGGHGITVQSVAPTTAGDAAVLHLVIAPDAPLGPCEVRLGTTHGVTSPRRFWVDVYPDVPEVEPNDTPAQAQTIDRTPVVIDGRIGAPMDRDVFAFHANAGETWVFDICAARLRSRLDPVLELREETGHLLKMAQSVWEEDPRLIVTFPKAGRYLLTLRDTQYLGGPDFVYRVTLGPVPAITGFLPHGVAPGQSVTLQLQGVNLGSTQRAPVSIPAEAAASVAWISCATEHGPALPIPLLVDKTPVWIAPESPAPLPLPAFPICVDGVFGRSPQAQYAFHAGPADHLDFTLRTRRLGSPIDGAIRVLDSAGHALPSTESTAAKDVRLEFSPPREGMYVLEARNVDETTGPDCGYRLEARRAQPDFRALLNVDHIHVNMTGTTALPIVVERVEGFAGPIRIQAVEMLPGVVCSGGIVAPEQNGTEITLTAGAGVVPITGFLHLRATAQIGGKPVAHEVVARESYLPRSIDPGMFTDDSYRRPYYTWETAALGVVEGAPAFTLTATPDAVTLTPGQKAQITVRAVRSKEAQGEIALEMHGLPDTVSVQAPPIAANKTETTITLTAGAKARATLRTIVIQGKLGNTVQPAPAIPFRVESGRKP